MEDDRNLDLNEEKDDENIDVEEEELLSELLGDSYTKEDDDMENDNAEDTDELNTSEEIDGLNPNDPDSKVEKKTGSQLETVADDIAPGKEPSESSEHTPDQEQVEKQKETSPSGDDLDNLLDGLLEEEDVSNENSEEFNETESMDTEIGTAVVDEEKIPEEEETQEDEIERLINENSEEETLDDSGDSILEDNLTENADMEDDQNLDLDEELTDENEVGEESTNQTGNVKEAVPQEATGEEPKEVKGEKDLSDEDFDKQEQLTKNLEEEKKREQSEISGKDEDLDEKLTPTEADEVREKDDEDQDDEDQDDEESSKKKSLIPFGKVLVGGTILALLGTGAAVYFGIQTFMPPEIAKYLPFKEDIAPNEQADVVTGKPQVNESAEVSLEPAKEAETTQPAPAQQQPKPEEQTISKPDPTSSTSPAPDEQPANSKPEVPEEVSNALKNALGDEESENSAEDSEAALLATLDPKETSVLFNAIMPVAYTVSDIRVLSFNVNVEVDTKKSADLMREAMPVFEKIMVKTVENFLSKKMKKEKKFYNDILYVREKLQKKLTISFNKGLKGGRVKKVKFKEFLIQ